MIFVHEFWLLNAVFMKNSCIEGLLPFVNDCFHAH